jgi:hypothetical protein
VDPDELLVPYSSQTLTGLIEQLEQMPALNGACMASKADELAPEKFGIFLFRNSFFLNEAADDPGFKEQINPVLLDRMGPESLLTFRKTTRSAYIGSCEER